MLKNLGVIGLAKLLGCTPIFFMPIAAMAQSLNMTEEQAAEAALEKKDPGPMQERAKIAAAQAAQQAKLQQEQNALDARQNKKAAAKYRAKFKVVKPR